MIGAVALGNTTAVESPVTGVLAGERSQSHRREQFPSYGLYYGTRTFGKKHAVRQAHRQEMIRAEGTVMRAGLVFLK
jgi:hypothetical protein